MARRMIKRGPANRRPPTARQRQAEQEQRKLDDALRDSFPASDPVSFLEPCPTREDKEKPRRPKGGN